jgi:hypothetical protein
MSVGVRPFVAGVQLAAASVDRKTPAFDVPA